MLKAGIAFLAFCAFSSMARADGLGGLSGFDGLTPVYYVLLTAITLQILAWSIATGLLIFKRWRRVKIIVAYLLLAIMWPLTLYFPANDGFFFSFYDNQIFGLVGPTPMLSMAVLIVSLCIVVLTRKKES